MHPDHDPSRQLRQLRQALAVDRMLIAFLLGAGCPCSIEVPGPNGSHPLIPGVSGLTELVCGSLESEPELSHPYGSLCEQFREDEEASPDIERILGRIRSLRDVAGRGAARGGLSAAQLDRLDVFICNRIDDIVRKELPSGDTAYHQLASWIAAAPSRDYAVEIFTTNYDLLMEQALEGLKIPYFDGFVGSNRTFFDVSAIEQDKLPSRWARLWKLHGSINWRQAGNQAVSRGEHIEEGERRLIHPSHLKYEQSQRMPYLAMFDRLRAFLRHSPAVLLTCGYSFRDQHLNEVLRQGLEGNATATCFALLHGNLSRYTDTTRLARLRPNLNVLAADGAVIGRREAHWLAVTGDGPSARPESLRQMVGSAELALAIPRFTLGDFMKFGEFLAGEVVGEAVEGISANAS